MRLKEIPRSVGEYVYEPLDLTRHQIRLLALKPSSSSDDPIECDIEVFDMNAPPHYITLSYVWGHIFPARYILLKGKRMRVRKNLFDFLLCFRNDMSNIHYLWIDQLSIAQTLDLERNHQVQLMSRVYRCCLYVIMWLGEKSYFPAVRFNKTYRKDAAYEVFHNPYFTRLWIVQEIILASEIRVFCGYNNEYTSGSVMMDDMINIADLDHIVSPPLDLTSAEIFRQEDDKENTEITIEVAWVPLTTLVSVMRSGDMHEYAVFYDSVFGGSDILQKPELRGSLPLVECIRRFSKYDCSNLRDKVYGLLGLVLEDQRPTVDYSKSEEEVVADVLMIMAKLQWKRKRKLDIIPHTRVPSQYWTDVLCLTGLAKDMRLEKQCHPLSYLMIEVYEIVEDDKAAGSLDFPIQAIGHESNEGDGHWWYKSLGMKHVLLDYPKIPAWTKMGLNLFPTGMPDRFKPYPDFHFDGTPWIRPKHHSSKRLLDHEMLSHLLAGSKAIWKGGQHRPVPTASKPVSRKRLEPGEISAFEENVRLIHSHLKIPRQAFHEDNEP